MPRFPKFASAVRLMMAATSMLFVADLAELGAQAPPLEVLGYRASVPTTWESRTPSSSMRVAEYVLPATGAERAEVVVYFFGVGQGGSPEANIERWRSQFSAPAGGSVFEEVTTLANAPFPTTVAEWRGSYARGVGTGPDAGAARPNHTLVSVIVQAPRGTIFFQLFGPSPRVAPARGELLHVIRGLK
jgi:hypothetical protein